FQAKRHPSEFELDDATRRRLEVDPSVGYEQIAQSFLDAGKTDLAIDAFKEASKLPKSSPGNLGYNLARVYSQKEQYAEALDELQKYFDAQLQSKGKAAYELLGELLKKLNKSDELIP